MSISKFVAGFGCRIFMIATFALFLTLGIKEDIVVDSFDGTLTGLARGYTASEAFLYLVPIGQGLAFLGSVAWILSSDIKEFLYPVLILLGTQLFMSMVYICYCGYSVLAIYVGMPIMIILSVIVLFGAGTAFFGDNKWSKALLGFGMVLYMMGHIVVLNATDYQVATYGSFGVFFVSYLITEIGLWIGNNSTAGQGVNPFTYIGEVNRPQMPNTVPAVELQRVMRNQTPPELSQAPPMNAQAFTNQMPLEYRYEDPPVYAEPPVRVEEPTASEVVQSTTPPQDAPTGLQPIYADVVLRPTRLAQNPDATQTIYP